MRKAKIIIVVLSLIVCIATVPQARAEAARLDVEEKPNAKQATDLIWGAKIPMRDGIHLNATIYRPHGQKDPLPAIFELTPYVSPFWDEPQFYFAQHDYVYAVVESRGRGNSEGKFSPFFQEAQDGYDWSSS